MSGHCGPGCGRPYGPFCGGFGWGWGWWWWIFILILFAAAWGTWGGFGPYRGCGHRC